MLASAPAADNARQQDNPSGPLIGTPFRTQRLNLTEARTAMLRYALIFFVVALIAALFGFGGIAAGATEIAKILFFVFVVLFVFSLVAGLVRRGP